MAFYQEEKTALFIDGPNLYSSVRGLDFQIDYRRLLEYFRDRCRLVRAFYYTAVPENTRGSDERIAIKPLVDWLDYNGYHLVTKATKQFEDRDGGIRTKGNMDVELAIDMLQHSPNLDHAVLFSGDGDFRRLVEACQHYCRVTVISSVRTSPPMIADVLRRQADVFLDLYDLRKDLQRENKIQDPEYNLVASDYATDKEEENRE